MKKVIEQINGIKRVREVVIDQLKDNTLIVRVEPEKLAVECKNAEQWNFTTTRCNGKPWSPEYEPVLNNVNLKTGRYCHKSYYEDSGFTIIPFSQYLTDYNLTDEWEKYLIGEAEKRGYNNLPAGTKIKGRHWSGTVKSPPMITIGKPSLDSLFIDKSCTDKYHIDIYKNGKWAEIVKDELVLVPGEIYCSEEDGDKWLFRFKSIRSENTADYYSIIDDCGGFRKTDWLCYKDSRRVWMEATKKQKKKLIKAEVKNNFYFELIKK